MTQQKGLLLLTIILWGTVWYAITFQLGEVPALVSVFYRIVIAAIFLLIYHKLVLKTFPIISFIQHVQAFVLGICLFSINYYLFYLATIHISSGLVSVIFSTLIIFNTLNNALFLKKAIPIQIIVGGVIGIIGIFFLFYESLFVQVNVQGVLKGVAYALLATYLVSLGNIASASLSAHGVKVLSSTTLGLCYGGIISGMTAFLLGNTFVIPIDSLAYMGSLLYLAIFCTAIAFILYLNLIKISGADRAAVATLLFPIVAIFISSIFGEYHFQWSSLLGLILVLIGSYISLFLHTKTSY